MNPTAKKTARRLSRRARRRGHNERAQRVPSRASTIVSPDHAQRVQSRAIQINLLNWGGHRTRIYNLLRAKNIRTLGDLVKWSAPDLMAVRGLGPRLADIILQTLDRRGLHLRRA